MPRMLVIGGSDSSAGAGIQADLKTGMAFRVEVSTVLTAITAQNSLGVQKISAVPAAMVTAQIDSVCSDLVPRVIKTGMLVNAACVCVVGQALQRHEIPFVVCDPVLASTSGRTLLNRSGREALLALFPRFTLVTPNAHEAAILCQRTVESDAEYLDAGRALRDLGASAVLLKGGHREGKEAADLLLLADQPEPLRFAAPRVITRNDHGTGCVLASAIAAQLALGVSLVEAVAQARTFVQRALCSSATCALGKGRGGMILFPPELPEQPAQG